MASFAAATGSRLGARVCFARAFGLLAAAVVGVGDPGTADVCTCGPDAANSCRCLGGRAAAADCTTWPAFTVSCRPVAGRQRKSSRLVSLLMLLPLVDVAVDGCCCGDLPWPVVVSKADLIVAARFCSMSGPSKSQSESSLLS